MRRFLSVLAVCGLLAGCTTAAPPAPTRPPVPQEAPRVTPTLADPSSPVPVIPTATTPSTAPAPALGSWRPTCTDAAADAAALVANLRAQPALAGASPSAAAGFADAAAAAVKPLYDCPVAHSLAVRAKISFGADAAAASTTQAKLSALLRTVKLTLSGTRLGRFPFGSVDLKAARPVLVAVLGEPDHTTASGCQLGGTHQTELQWGTFYAVFDDDHGGRLLAWDLRTTGTYPANLELADAMPFRATLEELRRLRPGLTYASVFGNDVEPFYAEPRAGLFYGWDTVVTDKSVWLTGGTMRPCD